MWHGQVRAGFPPCAFPSPNSHHRSKAVPEKKNKIKQKVLLGWEEVLLQMFWLLQDIAWEEEQQWGKGNIYQASKAADGCNGRESTRRMTPVGAGLAPIL